MYSKMPLGRRFYAANPEKMEDTFFSTASKAAESVRGQMKGPWAHVLSAMKMQGIATGMQGNQTV